MEVGKRREWVCKYPSSPPHLQTPITLLNRYNKEELMCPLCEYACIVEKSFRRHLKAHEAGYRGPVSKISCCICGRWLRERERKGERERVKYISELYRCLVLGCNDASLPFPSLPFPTTGKDRPSEAEMKKHMKKHRCGKYYRCDICKFQTVQLKKVSGREAGRGGRRNRWVCNEVCRRRD